MVAGKVAAEAATVEAVRVEVRVEAVRVEAEKEQPSCQQLFFERAQMVCLLPFPRAHA